MPEEPLTRDQVAAALRALREQAGYANQSEAARASGVPQPSVSRYERGLILPPESAVKKLLAVYRPDESTRRRLLAATQQVRAQYRRVVMQRAGAPKAQREFAELEAQAVRVTTFTPTVVPGLLQTDGYAGAIVGAALGEGVAREQWLDARRHRRARLEETGREFVQVTTAGALLWGLGDAAVMREQLAHLAIASQLPSVRFGIVPAAAIAPVHVLNGFDLYDLADGTRRVIVGTAAATAFLDDAQDVDLHVRLLEALDAAIAWDGDARAELDRLAAFYVDE